MNLAKKLISSAKKAALLTSVLLIVPTTSFKEAEKYFPQKETTSNNYKTLSKNQINKGSYDLRLSDPALNWYINS